MRSGKLAEALRKEIQATKDAAFDGIQPGDIHSWNVAQGKVQGLMVALEKLKTVSLEQDEDLS